MESNNPAKRLYEVLDATRGGGDTPLLMFWAKYLGSSEDYAGRVRIHFDVVQLVQECRRLIEGLGEVDKPLFLEPLDTIETALEACGTRGSCIQLINNIPDTALTALRFCDEILKRTMGEQLIEEQDLGNLHSDVESLISRIVDMSLPQEFKTILIDGLEEIRRAIILYRLLGAAGLKRAFESNLVMAARFRDQIENMPGSEDNRDVGRDFFKILSALDSILAAALKGKQLAGTVFKMLGAGGGSQ